MYIFIEISSRLPIRSFGYRLLVIYLLMPFNYALLTILTVLAVQASYSNGTLSFKSIPYSTLILCLHITITLWVWVYCILEIISPGICGAISSVALSRVLFNLLFFDIVPMNQDNFLWQWISTNCPSSLDYDHCYKAFYFSPSNCAADVSTCNLQLGEGYACPYFNCQVAVSQVTFYILITTFILMSFMLCLSAYTFYIITHLRKKVSKRSVLPFSNVPGMDSPIPDYSQQSKHGLELLPHCSELAYIMPDEGFEADGALLRIDLHDYAELIDVECSEF